MEPILALATAVRREPGVPFHVFGDISESGSAELGKALPYLLSKTGSGCSRLKGCAEPGRLDRISRRVKNSDVLSGFEGVPKVEAVSLKSAPYNHALNSAKRSGGDRVAFSQILEKCGLFSDPDLIAPKLGCHQPGHGVGGLTCSFCVEEERS